MSLLNDALKKAQNMQGQPRPAFPAPSQPTQPNPPQQAAPAAPAPQVVVQAERSGPGTKTVLGIAVAVFVATVGVLGVGGYFLFSKVSTQQPAEVAAATPTPEPAPAAAQVQPETVSVTPPPAPQPAAQTPDVVARPEPAAVSATRPEPVTAPEPGVQTAPATNLAAAQPAVAQPTTNSVSAPTIGTNEPTRPVDQPTATVDAAIEPTPAPVPAPTRPANAVSSSSRTPAPQRVATVDGVIIEAVPRAEDSLISSTGDRPDPMIEGWVAQINVSGVRLGNSPKVLMNDRVYKVGDVVNKKSGLVLSAIKSRELDFRDPAGNTYVLRF